MKKWEIAAIAAGAVLCVGGITFAALSINAKKQLGAHKLKAEDDVLFCM